MQNILKIGVNIFFQQKNKNFKIIGGGPAGFICAREILKCQHLEKIVQVNDRFKKYLFFLNKG